MKKLLKIFSVLFGLSMLFVSCTHELDNGTEYYLDANIEFAFSEDILNISNPVIRYVNKYGQEKETEIRREACVKRNYSIKNDSVRVNSDTEKIDYNKPICYVWTYIEKFSCGKYGDIKNAETYVISNLPFRIDFKDINIDYVEDSDKMFSLFAGASRTQLTICHDGKVNRETDQDYELPIIAEGEGAYLDFVNLSLSNVTGNIPIDEYFYFTK